jgi:small subunit ribosomal protein S2
MNRFVYATRSGVGILDLAQTATKLQESFNFVVDLVSRGGSILFLGTKNQATAVIKAKAEEVGMPYVNTRWLGGTFTNFETMYTRIKRLRKLEAEKVSGELQKYTKREQLEIEREIEKMRKDFGGIAALNVLPQAMFVVGLNKEKIAVAEARKKGIVVIALADTNCDPEDADFVIPANDDAVKSIELIANVITSAVKEGKARAAKSQETKEATVVKGVKKVESKEEKKEVKKEV